MVAIGWETTEINSVGEIIKALEDLHAKQWVFRGQSKRYNSLCPSIDRNALSKLDRTQKLALEQESIIIFRSAAEFFSSPGEQASLSDDIVALMVLRHYGAPTRFLDWSECPNVAAFFASYRNEGKDGEIWCFDHEEYKQKGVRQWVRWPQTTTDGSGAPDMWDTEQRTAFENPATTDWFVCNHYEEGFPRQNAQQGFYSWTSQFGQDHSLKIQELLDNPSKHHLFIIKSSLKTEMRNYLEEECGIWEGSLYPDSAGAAQVASSVFPKDTPPGFLLCIKRFLKSFHF